MLQLNCPNHFQYMIMRRRNHTCFYAEQYKFSISSPQNTKSQVERCLSALEIWWLNTYKSIWPALSLIRQIDHPSPSPAFDLTIVFMEYEYFLQAGFFTLRPIGHIMPCVFRGLGFPSIWYTRMCQNKRPRIIQREKISVQSTKQCYGTISSNIECCKINFFCHEIFCNVL